MKLRKPPCSAHKARPTHPTYTGELHRDFMEEGLKKTDISGIIVNRGRGKKNRFISNEGDQGQGDDTNNGVEAGIMIGDENIEIKEPYKRNSIRAKGASKTAEKIDPDQGITAAEARMKAAAQWNRLKVQRPILA